MKTVCIGGPCDGERADIPDTIGHGQLWEVARPDSEAETADPGAAVVGLVEFVPYRVVVMGVGPAGTKVLVHTSLSPGDMLQRLVEHYRPKEEAPRIIVPGRLN